ncbi:MAG: MFS transporter [Candidatus Hydrogenedentes bacterium]|nr:MFS transporter [Candidatus Hydrogenedentota bacterium]
MAATKAREFSWVEGLSLCLSMIGVQLCSEVINQWGLYFYSPSAGVGRTIYVSVGLVGVIFIVGTVWDAFSSPIVGAWSDKTPTRPGRWRLIPIPGRRLPFIFWGALGMILTMTAFWFPPVEGTSVLNLLYGTFFLCAHWTLFSVAVVPLTALGPEIARSEAARVAIGTWTAVGMILGLALANALPGVLIASLDPGRVESSLALEVAGPDAEASATGILRGLVPEEEAGSLSLSGHPGLETARPGGGRLLVTAKGELYDRMRARAEAGALEGAFPEALRGRFTPVRRRAWFGAAFPAGSVDAARMDEIRGHLLPAVRRALAASLETDADSNRHSLAFPTALAERMDPDGLATALAGVPGIGGAARVELAAAHLRVTLPMGTRPSGELGDALLDAVAREAVRANLILMGDRAGQTVVFNKALRAELTYSRLLASLPEDAGASLTRKEESYSPAGYRRVAVIFAFVSFVMFLLPIIFIRERYDSEAVQSEPIPYGRALLDALRNKPFVIYALSFFFFTIGFLAVQRVLPYWAELGLDGDESTITKLLVPFILVAVVSYGIIPIVARRVHMKWMIFAALAIIATGMPCMWFVGRSGADFATRQLFGMLLFGYCGIGQAIIYVMMVPMMGDIIDHDERLSGERREALYNGLSAFIWKASMAGSILLASQSMNLWGNRIEEYTGVLLVGPFAGLFGLIGMGIIAMYPVMKNTAGGEGKRNE